MFAATVLLGWLIVPSSMSKYWLDGTAWDVERILTPTDVEHSVLGFFARSAGTPTSPPAWGYPAAVAIAIVGLIAGGMAMRSRDALLALVLVGDTALLISPVTWMATMVWIVPSLIWLGLAIWRRPTMWPRLFGFILTLWFTVPIYWFAQRVGNRVPYQTTVAGNLIATVGSPAFPLFFAVVLAPLWMRYLDSPHSAKE